MILAIMNHSNSIEILIDLPYKQNAILDKHESTTSILLMPQIIFVLKHFRWHLV